ncbi:MAG: hypothetical protein QOK14_1818 [Frankiaceae bacterium]|nr:hypothetical protein [Frankiaceae bacterium]
MTGAGITVRAAIGGDVDAVVALVHSAYRGDSSRAGWTTEADLLDGLRTNADEVRSLLPHFLLAEVDGELVGCCTLIPKDGHAYFGMFAVRPGMQGGGIGSALLAAAEARTRALGLPAVEMTVLSPRTELIAFYERRGYVATGEVRPFPYGDPRFGLPRRDDLTLAVYVKTV